MGTTYSENLYLLWQHTEDSGTSEDWSEPNLSSRFLS